MSFRFRPSFEALELRDNPSGPDLVDPLGGVIDPTTGLPPAPPPDPTTPATTTPTTTTPTDPTVPVDPGILITH